MIPKPPVQQVNSVSAPPTQGPAGAPVANFKSPLHQLLLQREMRIANAPPVGTVNVAQGQAGSHVLPGKDAKRHPIK